MSKVSFFGLLYEHSLGCVKRVTENEKFSPPTALIDKNALKQVQTVDRPLIDFWSSLNLVVDQKSKADL